MYSMMGSVHLNASVISCSGRYGNVSCRSWGFSGSGC